MAQNNLRIINRNLLDLSSTSVTVSSTYAPSMLAANLKVEPKGLVWRSGVGTVPGLAQANLVVTFDTTRKIGGLIMAFTNLSASATIRIRGYTGTAPTMGGTVDTPTVTTPGTLQFDTGAVLCNQYQGIGFSDWSLDNNYSLRKMYSRVWLPLVLQIASSSLLVEIVDTTNPDKYVEASRLILGEYWSPQYNTSYEGLNTGIQDSSSRERTEAGDLVTNNGAIHNILGFSLKYMTPTDRSNLTNLIKWAGIQKPVFVSLFPDNSEDWDKEQTYQIYGKFSQLFGLEHPIVNMYSSQIEIEEI